ncbi:MAG: enoyl-CoA hydratase/isomerase family protein [Halapricum sp.]
MQSPEYEELDVTVSGGVCHVTMDTDAPFNAFTPTMVEELLEVAIRCNDEWPVRAIAITGSADGFCAGADLRVFQREADNPTQLRRVAGVLHEALRELHAVGVPIVTGVNGVAAGAGFGIALHGDVVLVAEDARLEFAYQRVGLAADAGTTYLLPRLVGLRKALEIVLLDEPIAPKEAVDLGLATAVVPTAALQDRLDELAHDLAEGPTAAFADTRALLYRSFDNSLPAQLADEEEAMARAVATDDFERGLAAFFEKGDPDFQGE